MYRRVWIDTVRKSRRVRWRAREVLRIGGGGGGAEDIVAGLLLRF